jgi:hypothetical protein
MEEIWKDIIGYEGYYEVSNYGNIRSIDRIIEGGKWGKEKRKSKNICKVLCHGICRVKLCKCGVKNFYSLSHLVLETFGVPRIPYMICCHNDGNPMNNRIDNLRWDTIKSNCEDSVKHGVQVNGERVHTHKLTEEDVMEILRIPTKISSKVVSEIYGVSSGNIRSIRARKTWKHLDCHKDLFGRLHVRT